MIEYSSRNIKCKTLFLTHYHELTDLENTLDNLHNVHVSAKEENGEVIFLHKVEDGSIDKSYGIHVAKLASLPDSLIKRADEILKVYENKEKKRDVIVQESLIFEEPKKESEIERKLKELDIMNLTPMDALNTLYKLKGEIEG